ncbi:MAG: tRNA (guanosine(46)-N7)-methyltransferase TrmB [Rhodobacter sp.]|nr:tRNA (guanosine(46)-N7)-methyltransferase TrmB [Rhodobacter sp.]
MTADPPDKRSIRSFVRRAGRITPAQKHALHSYWPIYGINYSAQTIVLPSKFNRCRLEIGIGNGDALLHMASLDPECLYIGVEVHEPGIGRCLNGIHERALANVRLIKHDAVEVLAHMIPPHSIERVLLFFPDPWHKKRHHKRRIVNARFRDLLIRALMPQGVIHVATDWEEYAEWIAEQFLGDERFVNLGDAQGYAACPDYRPQTRFEQRGRRLGHGVRDLLFAVRG